MSVYYKAPERRLYIGHRRAQPYAAIGRAIVIDTPVYTAKRVPIFYPQYCKRANYSKLPERNCSAIYLSFSQLTRSTLRSGRRRADVHWTSCGLRSAPVGAGQTSTGRLAPQTAECLRLGEQQQNCFKSTTSPICLLQNRKFHFGSKPIRMPFVFSAPKRRRRKISGRQ